MTKSQPSSKRNCRDCGGASQNMHNMRQFYEEWAPLSICQTLSSKMEMSSDSPVSLPDKDLLEIRQPLADELGTGDASAFMSVGFSHHMAIIRACKSSDERRFYIRKAASDFWSYRVLLQHIRANDYATQGKAVNNFALTMPDDKQVSSGSPGVQKRISVRFREYRGCRSR